MIGHVTTPKPIGLPQPSWVLLNVNKDCSISLSGYRILGFRLELYSAYWSTAVIGLCLVAIVLGLTKLCSSDHHFFDEDPSEGQTPPEYNHFARWHLIEAADDRTKRLFHELCTFFNVMVLILILYISLVGFYLIVMYMYERMHDSNHMRSRHSVIWWTILTERHVIGSCDLGTRNKVSHQEQERIMSTCWDSKLLLKQWIY